MDMESIFSERLRQARSFKGVSQQAAANALGIHKVSYQSYEYGKKLPSLARVPDIADFFDVSTDYLLGRSDDPHLPRMDEETKNLFLALRALKGNTGAAQ